MKFRKKPVVIDAVRWDGTEKCLEVVLPFIQDGKPDFSHLPPDGAHIHPGIGYTPPDGNLFIPTLEGTMTASPGDWIIRGVKGEFYPCKPDIFAATYEPADAAIDEAIRLREALAMNEKLLDSEMDKLLAMPDERIQASLRMEGRDPKDVATIGKQIGEIAILKHDLKRAEAASHNREGMVVVPREPTQAMTQAGYAAIRKNATAEQLMGMTCENEIYKAMLSAAPSAQGDSRSSE